MQQSKTHASAEIAADADMQTGGEQQANTLLFGFIPMVPLAFLGLGVYRAWIEIAFVGSFIDFPFGLSSMRDLFDSVMVITAIACAMFAQRIGTLVGRHTALSATAVLLVGSTALLFSSYCLPEMAGALGAAAAVLGGMGIALMILIWSEIYGCLNPLRVAIYYSLSIVVGALVVYVYQGFKFDWLFVMTALIPVVSLLMAHAAYSQLPNAERPARRPAAELSVPWKAVLLMATYAFAYGLLEEKSYAGGFGPHSLPGTLFAGLAIFVGVCARGKRFNFTHIYRGALPITVAAFLLLPAFNLVSDQISALCVSVGYTMQSILIMIVIATICYRYGANAIWLFGIERGVRQIFMILGRDANDFALSFGLDAATTDLAISALAVISIVAATMIFMSESNPSSTWGAELVRKDDELHEKTPAELRHELSQRVVEVSRECGLSSREEEVLLLLGQRKTVGQIERELFIANGTAKAHVRHVYQKLDIHTRQELFDKLGVQPEPDAAPANEPSNR